MKPSLPHLDDLERRLSRPRKRKPKMKVSGTSVRMLQQIIIKKGRKKKR